MRLKTILLCATLLCSQAANAHLLKIFAYAQPVSSEQQIFKIRGKVYFAGGSTLANLSLKVIDSNGTVTDRPVTDPQGKFDFRLSAGNYQIIADSLDGHIAKWQIKNISQLDRLPENAAVTNSQKGQLGQKLFSGQQLQSVIAEQLAIQIQPLSEQLNSLEEKARFQDIIGALGYIFGLYGLAIWWRQRKTSSNS